MDRVTSTTKIINRKCRFAIELLALILVVIGIILLCFYKQTVGVAKTINYTHCKDELYNPDTECANSVIPGEYCDCYLPVEITEEMTGQVTLFYELPTYDQKASNYVESKDDQQLRGILSKTPSKSCGNYSYVETSEGKKAIAPCGALADSMFNDTFKMSLRKKYLSVIYTGLDGITEEDKNNFRNPPGDLKQAFKNYTKPINWLKNIWEVNIWEADNTDPNNVGLQNERFIGWMNTDLKRKPAWRLNHTDIYEHGLPRDNYTLRIRYAYPYSLYSGERLVILSTLHTVSYTARLVCGIILIIVGVLLAVLKVIYNRKTYKGFIQPPYKPS